MAARVAPSESGHVLLYTLAFIAFLTLCISLTVILASGSPGAALWLAPLAGAVLTMSLLPAYHRDRIACLTFMATLALMTALIALIWALVDDPPNLISASLAAAAGIVGILMVVEIVRDSRRPESPDFPNLLRRDFEDAFIFERHDVQLAARTAVQQDRPGHWQLVLYLQNCVTAERDVRLRLEGGSARFPDVARLELGPGEVGLILVPVQATTSERSFELTLSAHVRGGAGRRIRHWRARTLDNPLPRWLRLLVVPFGLFVWGGGLRFRFETDSGLVLDEPGVNSPGAESEIIWRPAPGALAAYQPLHPA